MWEVSADAGSPSTFSNEGNMIPERVNTPHEMPIWESP